MSDSLPRPPYLTSAQRIHEALQSTMRQAIADLPPAIKAQHWLASKHAPAAWRAVEHWYRGQPHRNDAILEVLSNLALLSDALASLTSVTTPVPTEEERPLDLSLKKQKRVDL